jgi:hypothetical protein
MPAMARIFAADFSHRSFRNLKLAIGAPSSDRCGITDLLDAAPLG